MHLRTAFIVAIIVMVMSAPCFCQSWNSARPGTSIVLDAVFENGSYTWTFTNVSGAANDGTAEYDVLAWSLQPFNIPIPSSVTAPDGWVWVASDGWSRFELADKRNKFAVRGPALEPGESLIFTYTPVVGGRIVNPGGPGTGRIDFITHIGAIKSHYAGRQWISAEYLNETQWHEIVSTSGGEMAPEPTGMMALLVGCVGLIRVFRNPGSRSL